MKTIIKVAFISMVIGAILMIAGALTGAARAFQITNKGINFISNNAEPEIIYMEGEITSIHINSSLAGIEFIESDRYAVEITHYGIKPAASLENGYLRITHEGLPIIAFGPFGFSSYINEYRYKIYLPKDVWLKKVSVSITAGSVDINGLKSGDVVLSCTAGKITAVNVETDVFTAESTTGSIYLEDITAKAMTLDITAGEVDAQHLTTKSLRVESTTGNVSLGGALYGSNTVRGTAGRVRVRTTLPKESYSCDISTTTGNVTIDGKNEGFGYERDGGENSLRVNLTTGSVAVDF